MSREALKDRLGHLIGYIEDRPGEQYGYNALGHKKGKYDKKSNITYDEHGCRVGTGNLLATLITE